MNPPKNRDMKPCNAPPRGRATAARGLAALACAALAACATSAPPVQLYRLNVSAPVATASVAPAALNWQLMQPVNLPEYLDRDAILLPQGQNGLQAAPGHRWAEPLRSSVPRVLRQDLATLLGEAHVWAAPVPAGIAIARQLRVELLALDVDAGRSAVVLRARWSLTDPAGTATPRSESVALSIPAAGADVDSLVAAHRLALWRLAERIVATP